VRWWTKTKVLLPTMLAVREGHGSMNSSTQHYATSSWPCSCYTLTSCHGTKRNLKNRRDCNWRENGSKHYLGKSMGRGKKEDGVLRIFTSLPVRIYPLSSLGFYCYLKRKMWRANCWLASEFTSCIPVVRWGASHAGKKSFTAVHGRKNPRLFSAMKS
jgi:hypothetical protein